MTNHTLRSPAIYRMFFRAALQQQLAARADYDADVRDWYENGDGRPVRFEERADSDTGIVYSVNVGGQGHTYPECIHSSSLWTDYDNICGGCEESLTAVQEAQSIARSNFADFNDRWEWYLTAPSNLPDHLRKDLLDWVTALLPKEN